MDVGDLEVVYGTNVACADVTLAVDRGSSVAIVGPSGSGKSSLLLAVAGLVAPSAGTVRIGTTDLWALPRRDRDAVRRRRIGYVAQFSDLVPELSNLENVALPLRLLKESSAAARSRAEAMLAAFGVAHLGGRLPYQVSGGEMQRVAIARSLVHKPSVLLADEPTGALDEDNRGVVLEQLMSAARDEGAAVVIVTHDQTLARAADRMVSMSDGRLEPWC